MTAQNAQTRPDASDMAEFHEMGHATLPGALPATLIDGLRGTFLSYVAQKHEGLSGFEKSLGASATKATFSLSEAPKAIRDLVCAPALAEIAARALGADRVRVLHFNGFFKPGGGMATPWHQDMGYIPLDCEDVVTTWVPLVAVSEEMGPLVFASGSHRAGAQPMTDLGTRYPLRRAPEMMPGDVSLHHGWTAHCSLPNRSKQIRAAVAISYFPDGARLHLPDGGPPMMDSLRAECMPGLAPGDLVTTPATPVVYPPCAA